MIWVRPLKLKADFVNWFIKMDAIFFNQYGTHVSTLHTDNGGEYINQRLKEYCDQHGILLELTVPHTLQQNGVAERANWMLTKCMCCRWDIILLHGLPPQGSFGMQNLMDWMGIYHMKKSLFLRSE